MRISYRAHGGSQDYWQRRWDDVAVDSGDINLDRYPGRYAEQAMKALDIEGPILEAGCGAGRVLRHYHDQGADIIGMDFITSVLHAIHREDAGIPLAAGDIRKLPFSDDTFAAVLAFGLYHGLESGLEEALAETRRVMKTGGVLCASMRLDNLQNRMTDRMAAKGAGDGPKSFHKLNLTAGEVRSLISAAGFEIEAIDYVENMSFLYKYPALRHASQRKFQESEARGAGYRFNLVGNALQRTALVLAPAQMANLTVFTARGI